MPRSIRRHLWHWAGTLAVAAFILTLPVWIPVLFIRQSLDTRRRRKAAESFTCVTCGGTLGAAALRAADEAWKRHVSDLLRRHPDLKFRLHRTLHAICPACGTRYRFVDADRTFVVDSSRNASA